MMRTVVALVSFLFFSGRLSPILLYCLLAYRVLYNIVFFIIPYDLVLCRIFCNFASITIIVFTMRRLIIACCMLFLCIATAFGQDSSSMKKVYDETLDPVVQINKGVEQARRGKNLVCQLGGNWCPWCLRFASFITADEEIRQFVDSNYVYIHVNVPRSREVNEAFDSLTHHASRFGFPVLLVYDGNGTLLHTQDSVFLEEGKGYNKKHVMTFFKQWTCSAVSGVRPQR